MKKIQFYSTAAILAAVLFSCNSGTQETKTESHEEHEHATTATSDTVVIAEGQSVNFANLKSGDVVKGPVVFKFQVRGMQVQSIDSGIQSNKGHHHLLIDTMAYIPAGQPIPVIENRIVHFGKGQTESKPVELSKGKHKISLQFADGVHRSYGQKMSATVEIEVK